MPHNRYLPTDLNADAGLRLFALPYAGGGAAGYFRWRPAVGPGIDVIPVLLPGREARINEPPIADLRRLTDEIADAVAPWTDRPFALLGHSLGAILAFELSRELRRRGERRPCLLIAAASPAPHRPRAAKPLCQLADAEFVAELNRRFDGIPAAVRANDELLQLLLPAMRTDIELLETYEYVDQPPLETDILTLGGVDDRAVSATELSDWRRHTSGRFSNRLLPGGHFFLFPTGERDVGQQPAGVRLIAEQLERHLKI